MIITSLILKYNIKFRLVQATVFVDASVWYKLGMWVIFFYYDVLHLIQRKQLIITWSKSYPSTMQ